LATRFISVPCGADGTTRDLNRDVVTTLHKSSCLRVTAHLTCVDASREEISEIDTSFATAGVADIVALRVDPAKGQTRFRPHPEGYTSSVELIAALAKTRDFTLRVGAYPETHPETHPEAKTASQALAQFFFEAETFLRFRDACDKAGIRTPITPGILPIENWAGTQRFAKACKTRVPDWLGKAF
jgi:methylenetetrahydrofolate reductase (NADPH)